jgi:hypothetical protein
MTTTKPTSAAFAPMAYYATGSKLVLLNTGNFPAYETMNVETDTFNGTDWTKQLVGLSVNPPLRDLTSMALDPSTGNLVVFGGVGLPGTELLNDTLEYAGSSWVSTNANYNSTGPSIRKQAYVAPMTSPSSQMFLWGGSDAHFMLQDSWQYVGGTWTQLSPTHTPPIRTGASFASNGTNQAILCFGANESFTLNDAWSWNGTDWSQLIAGYASSSPSVRRDCAFAFLPGGTPSYILFGGQDTGGRCLQETWQLTPSGPTWAKLTPANSPSARIGASMFYDTASSQLVLFGGSDQWGNKLNDTWNWTGTNWVQL